MISMIASSLSFTTIFITGNAKITSADDGSTPSLILIVSYLTVFNNSG